MSGARFSALARTLGRARRCRAEARRGTL